MHRGAWRAIVHGVTKSRTQLSDQYFHFHDFQSSPQFDPNLQAPPPVGYPPQQKHAPPCTHHLHSTTKVSCVSQIHPCPFTPLEEGSSPPTSSLS